MNLESKQTDLGRIYELMRIVNEGIGYSDSETKRVFKEEDIYRKKPQEVTILGSIKKHKYSFIKRMKAKIELYEIYSENEDNIIKKSIISEIGNPNIFYRIFNSVID
jgi:hypothetical protein